MYSSTLSLISTLDEGGWLTPRLDRFTPGNDLVSILGYSRNRVVGIRARYGLDGPGIECLWRRDFPHPVQTRHGAYPAF